MAQEQKSTRRKEQKAPKNTSCPRAARPVCLPEGNILKNKWNSMWNLEISSMLESSMKILGTLYRGSLYCEIIKLVTGRTITCCCCVAGKPLHPINIPEYHIKIRAISHHEYPHRISSYIETQKNMEFRGKLQMVSHIFLRPPKWPQLLVYWSYYPLVN